MENTPVPPLTTPRGAPLLTSRGLLVVYLLLIIIVAVAVIFSVLRQRLTPDAPTFVVDQASEVGSSTSSDLVPVTDSAVLDSSDLLPAVYYVTDSEGKGDSYQTTYTFYRATANVLETVPPGYVLTVGMHDRVGIRQGQAEVYVTRDNGDVAVVEVLNLKDFTLQQVAKIPKTKDYFVGDVRRLSTNELAYIRYQDGLAKAENSILEVFSMTTNAVTEQYPLTESSKYSGYRFVTAYDNGAAIVVENIGGDAGYVWSKWYRINRKAGEVVPLSLPRYPLLNTFTAGSVAGTEGSESVPAPVAFSSDGARFAYIDYSRQIPGTAFETEVRGDGSCDWMTAAARAEYANEGGVVKVYDLRTNTEKEVYRENKLYADNVCMLQARRLFGVAWLSHDELAVASVDTVRRVTVHTQQVADMFTFGQVREYDEWGWHYPGPGSIIRPTLMFAREPYLYFEDTTIGITKTNKTAPLVPNTVRGAIIAY